MINPRCEFCGSSHSQRITTCKFCGVEKLEWHRRNARGDKEWTLYSPGSHVVHVCKAGEKIVTVETIKEVGGVSYDDTQIRADIATIKSDVDTLAPMIQGIADTFESKIPALIARVEALDTKRELVIKRPDKVEYNAGRQHKSFEKLCTYLSMRLNVGVVGGAGGGKTHAFAAAYKALGLDFYPMSFGPQTSKSDIIGYMDANGNKVETNLTRAYQYGGGFLGDEFDASNAGVVTIMNAATSNNVIGLPWGTVERHDDFIAGVAMNTYGRGADALYVGRAQLDGATLDRYRPLVIWDYDWSLLEELTQNDEWTHYVEKLFNVASDLRLRVVIGPRIALVGAKMLAAGVDRETVMNEVVWAGITADDKAKILANLK